MGGIGRPLVPIVTAMSTERPLGDAWHVEERKKKNSLYPSLFILGSERRYHSSSMHRLSLSPSVRVVERNVSTLNH